jgi:hypothetical protein
VRTSALPLLLMPTAVALSMAVPLPARARCRVNAPAAYLEKVEVRAGKLQPFFLTLNTASIQITPHPMFSALKVQAPLRFDVQAYPTGKIAWRMSRETRLLGGRLTLAKGVQPTLVAVKNNALKVDLPHAGFVLPRRSVELPCSAVTVASKRELYTIPSIEAPKAGVTRAGPSGAEATPFYRTPRATGPLWVKLQTITAVVARKPGWVQLELRWSDGSSLKGWVPRKLVELDPKMLGPLRTVGTALGQSRCRRSHRPRLVAFTLKGSAPIAAGPDGPVWAKATAGLEVLAFPISRADGWVQVGKVKGLPAFCGEHKQIWVHAKNIIWR